MNYTFLYAGQGAQKAGMGKDFYETYQTYANLVDSFSLPFDHKQLMHEGSLEELSKTEYTQPCMAVFAAGITALLKEHGITPCASLGLSLGEYGALHAAGVFSAQDYVQLVAYRGNVMARAAEGISCAMSAILGVPAKKVEDVCSCHTEKGYVTVANYNCPGQYVICGEERAVAAVEAELKEAGARRCIRLNVSGPFHTRFMKPAGDALSHYFDQMTFHKPEIPVVLNVTGNFYQPEEDLKQLLVAQVQSSVRLEDSFKALLLSGAEHFIEIGPGKTLSGFLKKCAKELHKNITVHSIETVDDLKKLLQV